MLAVLLAFGCSGGGEKQSQGEKSLSFAEKIELKQYKVQGEILYAQHCGNCHQADGTGLGKLIPPLTQIADMASRKEQLACIIKNGMEGPVVVNGQTYNGKMPPALHLTNLEIAEILTFVGNSWNNSVGIVKSGEVEDYLSACRP